MEWIDNHDNIYEFVRKKYPNDAHTSEIEKALGIHRKYILEHLEEMVENEEVIKTARGSWKLKTLGEIKGTRIIHGNEKIKLAEMPVGQQAMSGTKFGTVWIEGKNNQGLSQIDVEYCKKHHTIPISGQENFESYWDVRLNSDELYIWGENVDKKGQSFIICYVTPRLKN